MIIKDDHYFMKKALLQARVAYKKGEVPVGAIVVKDGEIIIQTQQELVLVSDHRLVDGALAAKFLCDVVEMLEHPDSLD